MSEGVTVKTNMVRSHTLFVSSGVMQDLRALAMSNSSTEEPLLCQPDALGDMMLRQALDAIPGILERRKAISAFFRDLPQLEKQP